MKILVFAVIALWAGSATANVTESRWQFRVLLDEKEIGYHEFVVSNQGDDQIVESVANFDVKVLFVNLYKYRHRNREQWSDNCLVDIDAETSANGQDYVVHGSMGEAEFLIRTNTDQTSMPPCLMTFAYWNPAFLEAEQLLNSQTGELEPVQVFREGVEPFDFNGETLSAVRYRLEGNRGPITLWYALLDDRWLALETVAQGDRVIRYEPLVVPKPQESLIADADYVR